MSPAFISGIRDHPPVAAVTFDRFHIMAQLGKAVDEVRRAEVKHRPLLLRRTRWLWLTNRGNLSPAQLRELVWLTRPSVGLATARAHRWREDFQGFYNTDPDLAEAYLQRWCTGAMRSRLDPSKHLSVSSNGTGTASSPGTAARISTGLLEGTNSLVQAAKARARGYRNKRYMITIIYLIAAKLHRPSLTVTHPI